MWNTISEINAQPGIWRDWAAPLDQAARKVRDFIKDHGIREIWLSGAGTSAFVGEVLARAPHMAGAPRLRAVATTDFVSSPGLYLGAEGPVAVLQFGRSGNSSESVAMLDLLDAHFPQAHRIHVSCNPKGALATRPAPGPGAQIHITLPEATHDSGFAMTSSFTTMLLSALAALDPGFDAAAMLPRLADAADAVLPELWKMDMPRPARAIFLGAGALTGVARESALKVLELTAGQVMTAWDSTLGFRHGPKAAIGDNTTVFVMIHPDAQVARYDHDIAAEIAAQYPDARVVTIAAKQAGTNDGAGPDIALDLTGNERADGVLYVLPAQVFSARWSQELGLNVDNPFEGQGNLTRVVAGVKIYPYQPE